MASPPNPCAASSIIMRLNFSAISSIKRYLAGRPNKSITPKERIVEPEVRGEIIKVGRAKKLTRTPVEPVNQLSKRGVQYFGARTMEGSKPKSNAQLQKITPAKPKPKLVKPKKVKIKVKPNKTKIKIKN